MDTAYITLLENSYGLKALSFFRQRGNFIVQTEKGTKELKKNTSDPKRILFENNARNHLAASGFPAETFIPALEGLPYSVLEDTNYVLTDYFPSSSADLSKESSLLRCARLLGQFHSAAKGLFSEFEVPNTGNLIVFYEKRIREMKKIRNRISQSVSPSKVDIIIKENYGYYLDRAEKALDILKNSDYPALWEKSAAEKRFVHGAFKRDSIRISENKKSILITNFSKCAVDVQLTDLSEYIRRYMKNTDPEFSVIEKILTEYGKTCPLSDPDIKVLSGLLTYPYKFMKLLNEHYNKRRVYVSDAVCERFMKCVNRIPREDRLLEKIWGLA